ncbi:pyruvate kinase [Butyrivibrio sp. YAB3001]|uniref:pyruvate kinase n=1 Tax=Butyrivibrio sp. YAB3001 TaxID=1520812 RepID=UPI0008F68D82|nr:pyruvate kinase [Butyrivibrio sp. YAB3001]SFB72947.1 pyruvate kinase [Butyrivibrio sp. YAB3001]
MVDIFGTLGPSCEDLQILSDMFRAGMTGIRINLSHVMLKDCIESISRIKKAAEKNNIAPIILIDMQGPELRIGKFENSYNLKNGNTVYFGEGGIPLDKEIVAQINVGDEILIDDGKILARVSQTDGKKILMQIERGGVLTQRKSIKIVGRDITMPALTDDDKENIGLAKEVGITGIMQPFARSRDDLEQVRKALSENECENIRIYAKIENKAGIDNLESFIDLCDEVIIARGDLGNCMPLWELPHIQKTISRICNEHNKPFMVVTQMLSSMEKSAIPTRAEVSDIYNAVLDGASSVMVTGETAIGAYPGDVIKYLFNTAREAGKHPEDARF